MAKSPTRPTASVAMRKAQQASRPSRLPWLIVVAVLVVAAAGLVAWALSRGGDANELGGTATPSGTVVPAGDVNFGQVAVTGERLPQAPDAGQADSGVGKQVPGIAGVSFDGTTRVAVAKGGKPKVIIAVAHWCPHCQAEVPRLQAWFDANGLPSDVEVVTIATGSSQTAANWPPSAWLRREKWSVPTMVDDQQGTAAAAIGLGTYPFFVVVDKDGKVVERPSGEKTEQEWEALLDAARRGTAS